MARPKNENIIVPIESFWNNKKHYIRDIKTPVTTDELERLNKIHNKEEFFLPLQEYLDKMVLAVDKKEELQMKEKELEQREATLIAREKELESKENKNQLRIK